MILDHLNKEYNLNAKYEILEANTVERLGGRLFSYYFKDHGGKPLGPHQYFDVGAMRFPDIKVMERTFELFREVGIKAPDNPERPRPGDLIPYYYDGGDNIPKLYNGIQTLKKSPNAEDFKLTGLDPKYVPLASQLCLSIQSDVS